MRLTSSVSMGVAGGSQARRAVRSGGQTRALRRPSAHRQESAPAVRQVPLRHHRPAEERQGPHVRVCTCAVVHRLVRAPPRCDVSVWSPRLSCAARAAPRPHSARTAACWPCQTIRPCRSWTRRRMRPSRRLCAEPARVRASSRAALMLLVARARPGLPFSFARSRRTASCSSHGRSPRRRLASLCDARRSGGGGGRAAARISGIASRASDVLSRRRTARPPRPATTRRRATSSCGTWRIRPSTRATSSARPPRTTGPGTRAHAPASERARGSDRSLCWLAAGSASARAASSGPPTRRSRRAW